MLNISLNRIRHSSLLGTSDNRMVVCEFTSSVEPVGQPVRPKTRQPPASQPISHSQLQHPSNPEPDQTIPSSGHPDKASDNQPLPDRQLHSDKHPARANQLTSKPAIDIVSQRISREQPSSQSFPVQSAEQEASQPVKTSQTPMSTQ